MPLPKHELRYPGTRWCIISPWTDGLGKFAVIELQRIVQQRLQYVLPLHVSADKSVIKDNHLIIVGTAEGNHLIQELVKIKSIDIPKKKEAYAVTCRPSPWGSGKKMLVVAGSDAPGVLYGVMDLCGRLQDNSTILGGILSTEAPYRLREDFDGMPEFSLCGHPLIANRGIWTWGYVIYDYRRFFDNMARLRMNMITIWNDVPPVNSPEVIEYAHSRNIKVVFGFPWGWGYEGLDLAKAEDRRAILDSVLKDYRDHYAHLNIDGIYFQTLTEHKNTHIRGRSVAAWCCELVNEIAEKLYAIKPDLHLQFGLHATSIGGNYADLKVLDPRVVITWEDAGVLPFSYDPVTFYDDAEGPRLAGRLKELDTPSKTLEYAKKLATFRKGAWFAMVPKGLIFLRWGDEFEHHGPFILGERDSNFIRRRLAERQPRWDRMNSLWLKNYTLMAKFYRGILGCNPPGMIVTGLLEDGLLEEKIQLSASLFAQIIWNPQRDDLDLLQHAMSPYYLGG